MQYVSEAPCASAHVCVGRGVSRHGGQRAVPHEGHRPLRGIGLSAEARRGQSVARGAAERARSRPGKPEGDTMNPA